MSKTSEKHPQFNFSSQNLGIEGYFFQMKWEKVTKIRHNFEKYKIEIERE